MVCPVCNCTRLNDVKLGAVNIAATTSAQASSFSLVSCVFLQPRIQLCWDRLCQVMHVVVGVQELRAASLGGAASSAGAGAGSGGAAAGAAVQEAAVNMAASTAAAAGDRQGGSGSQQVGPPVHQPFSCSACALHAAFHTLRMHVLQPMLTQPAAQSS